MKKNKIIDRGNYYEVILNSRLKCKERIAKIDKEDVEKILVCSWSYSNTTEGTQGWVNKKITSMHQYLMGKNKGLLIDHVNQDRLDNRRSNLRWATKSQNGMNQRKRLGITYVKFRPECPKWKKRWLAQIQFDGKKDYKYCYSKKEALIERRKMELKYFKEFAKMV